MTLTLPFDNSYARLPDRFYVRQDPVPVAAPSLFALNAPLAVELGLDPDGLRGADGLAVLAGNATPGGADPLAQAYAGHQFGGWVPQLGDGRAILLGEIEAPAGRRDIQLKGAGRTPFSRGGDGRAWLGPVLREYVVSEAMHALGIPTTRALAAVTTGEEVLREVFLPGAVLTRIARSHIRVGTFQYFAARGDLEALEALTAHVVARHYPDAAGAEGLLDAVIGAQARLVAGWMGVGFIHGVMNTDNMSIAGETIDYGPCAFLDGYHPDTVFSSIDRMGRYAYARQPTIAAWNLAQLATCLVPLMGASDTALPRAQAMIDGFADRYAAEWLAVFEGKLGLDDPGAGNVALIQDLLDRMAAVRADFTLTFRGLSDGTARAQFHDPDVFDDWYARWQARGPADTNRANPAVIPRNHQIERVIAAAVAGDRAPFDALTAALAKPFAPAPDFAAPPRPEEAVIATFCGT